MADPQIDAAPQPRLTETEERQSDFAKIEAALQQSPRGRWFLDEYTKRNRAIDTRGVLAAIELLESVIAGRTAPASASHDVASAGDRRLVSLKDMTAGTAETIAGMEQATKDATTDILLATEAIQDFTWQLRDHGVDRETCETIERHTADIYAACSFQDVVFQRKENALHLLHLMADQLEALIGGPQTPADERAGSEAFENELAEASGAASPEDAQTETRDVPEESDSLDFGLEEDESAESMAEQIAEYEAEAAEDPAGYETFYEAGDAPDDRDAGPSQSEPEPSRPEPPGHNAVLEAFKRLDWAQRAALFG